MVKIRVDTSTIVAKLTHDHLDKKKGNLEFTVAGFDRFWGWPGDGLYEDVVQVLPKTQFKLYDDDGELYYSGWLKDDDEGKVQQFVLAWAMADSGCTTIKVNKNGEWVQVIG